MRIPNHLAKESQDILEGSPKKISQGQETHSLSPKMMKRSLEEIGTGGDHVGSGRNRTSE
jgi:hypothetical protein